MIFFSIVLVTEIIKKHEPASEDIKDSSNTLVNSQRDRNIQELED